MRRWLRVIPSWQRSIATFGIAAGMAGYALGLGASTSIVVFLVLGFIMLAGSLVGLPLQGLGVSCLVGGYVVALFGSGPILDPGAPLIGVGAYLLLELVYEERIRPDWVSPKARRSRAWSPSALAAAGFALSSVVLVLGSTVSFSGPLSVAAGGVVMALLLGAVLWATRSLLAPDQAPRDDR